MFVLRNFFQSKNLMCYCR